MYSHTALGNLDEYLLAVTEIYILFFSQAVPYLNLVKHYDLLMINPFTSISVCFFCELVLCFSGCFPSGVCACAVSRIDRLRSTRRQSGGP